MGFKILVLSPLSNIGTTVVSSLIAHAATFDNKTSHLIYTETDSPISTYLGIQNVDDPTRSVMQIVKLIDSQSISDKDILDYGHQYSRNTWLLNAADASLEGSDKAQVINHIFNRAPCDLSICDCSEDIHSELAGTLIEAADMIFLVCTMSRKSQIYTRSWLESEYLKDKVNVYIICNQYNEVTFALRNFAKVLVQPANRVCKVHYNPWIELCCNKQTLTDVVPLARTFDPRVAGLAIDMAEIMQCINAAMLVTGRKGI